MRGPYFLNSHFPLSAGFCSYTLGSGSIGVTFGPQPATSTISTAIDDITIEDVVLTMSLTHGYTGDLSVSLTHSGLTQNVISNPGNPVPSGEFGCGVGLALVNAVFTDEAGANDFELRCDASQTSEVFQPIDPFSTFNGTRMVGDWTLQLFDSYPAEDHGILTAWELTISGICRTSSPTNLPTHSPTPAPTAIPTLPPTFTPTTTPTARTAPPTFSMSCNPSPHEPEVLTRNSPPPLHQAPTAHWKWSLARSTSHLARRLLPVH